MADLIFTEDQQYAYDNIINFIEKGSNTYTLLEGAAGTGKSTITAHIIRYVLDNALFGKIAVAAPTHKAVRVVKRMFTTEEHEKVDFTSLHSLLGLKHNITSNGKEIFKRDPRSVCKLAFYDLIVVDEASMIADELFKELDEQNFRGVKVLFVGDSNQINPINHLHSVPMLEEKRKEYNIGHFKLTKVVRQAEGNPIIQVSQKVLKNEFIYEPGQKQMVEKTGVVTLNSDNTILKKLLHLYFCSEKFDNNTDYCKVLAWTNATVDIFNKTIRKMKYGNAPKIVKGEKLIVDRPIKYDGDNVEVMFTTNEDLVVLEVEESQKEVNGQFYKFYLCQVKGDLITDEIRIIHEDSVKDFEIQLKKLADSAEKEKDIKSRIKKWREYYGFMEEFAAVKYNYAITVHNSQGSTYENAFIVYQDINKNYRADEKRRILYTAITRPKEMLFII
jgi:ATP-dependent exoDNAse (exonuclease V) alpha subunit